MSNIDNVLNIGEISSKNIDEKRPAILGRRAAKSACCGRARALRLAATSDGLRRSAKFLFLGQAYAMNPWLILGKPTNFAVLLLFWGILHDCVLVFVSRCATAQKLENLFAGIGNLVFFSRRDCDCIARADGARFIADLHPSLPLQNIVNLLGFQVSMWRRAARGRKSRFGQSLVADAGISMRQQFADFRTVLGDESRNVVDILDIHKESN
jgi:hypothetical protein